MTLIDTIFATLVDETEPWPPTIDMLDASPEFGDRDLLQAFTAQGNIGDTLYILMDHDLITPEEVDRLARPGDCTPFMTYRPLLRQAYLDAIARGLVPGRLN